MPTPIKFKPTVPRLRQKARRPERSEGEGREERGFTDILEKVIGHLTSPHLTPHLVAPCTPLARSSGGGQNDQPLNRKRQEGRKERKNGKRRAIVESTGLERQAGSSEMGLTRGLLHTSSRPAQGTGDQEKVHRAHGHNSGAGASVIVMNHYKCS